MLSPTTDSDRQSAYPRRADVAFDLTEPEDVT
jgi:hypothetical protein